MAAGAAEEAAAQSAARTRGGNIVEGGSRETDGQCGGRQHKYDDNDDQAVGDSKYDDASEHDALEGIAGCTEDDVRTIKHPRRLIASNHMSVASRAASTDHRTTRLQRARRRAATIPSRPVHEYEPLRMLFHLAHHRQTYAYMPVP